MIPSTSPSRPIITANRPLEWGVALFTCAAVAAFMVGYHDWWRNKPWSLVVAHEVMALAAVFGLSTSLLVGPLGRVLGKASTWGLRWRRPLALGGALCASLHILIVLVLLHDKYPWSWYLGNIGTALLGLLALVLMAALVATSWARVVQALGPERWHRLHAWSWLLLTLVLLHCAPTRVAGWITWFRDRPLPAPGGTFLWSMVALAVLLIRVWARVRPATRRYQG